MINFAELVSREFEAQLMLSRQVAPTFRSRDCYLSPFLFVDLADISHGRTLHMNRHASKLLCGSSGRLACWTIDHNSLCN